MSNTQAITRIFNTHQAFFAFSDKQFEEKKVEGVQYVSLGSGLICPKENSEQLIVDLNKASEQSIQDDLANNSAKDIVWRELANHEAQIIGCIEDTVDALDGYGFSREFIQEVYQEYFKHCCEHDLF